MVFIHVLLLSKTRGINYEMYFYAESPLCKVYALIAVIICQFSLFAGPWAAMLFPPWQPGSRDQSTPSSRK